MDVADRFGLHYASVSIFSLSLYIYVCFLYLSWRSVVQLILLSEEKYVCERCFHITTDSDKD